MHNRAIVHLFLDAGVPANAMVRGADYDYHHQYPTLSFFAAKTGALEILENLLQRVKDTNNKNYDHELYWAMSGALIGKQLEIVKILLAKGAKASESVPVGFLDERFFCASVNNKPFFREPFFVYSIHQQTYNISVLLIEQGININRILDGLKSVLHWKMASKDETTIREAKESFKKDIQDIFDVAMGFDFAEAGTEKFLDNLDDLSGLNLIGISFNGEPLTKEKIKGSLATEHINGWENTIDTPAALSNIADEARRLRLQNRLLEKQKQWGKLEDANGIVNLVPLISAVKRGDPCVVETRLQANVHPDDNNFTDGLEPTLHFSPYGVRVHKDILTGVPFPIVIAAQHGHVEIVNLLMSTGKADSKSYVTACALAEHGGYKNVVSLLQPNIPLNAQDRQGRTLINLAAILGDYAAIPPLVVAGNDPNIPDNRKQTPMLSAISCNQRTKAEENPYLKVVATLLSYNTHTWGVFEDEKYNECVERILLRNFDFNILRLLMPSYLKEDPNLSWYLNESLSKDDIRIYELFHQAGISFNVIHNEVTFLNHALKHVEHQRAVIWNDELTPEEKIANDISTVKKGTELIEFLVQHGADINLPNLKDGKTALHRFIEFSSALGWNLQRFVKLLVDANINWNAQDKYGYTALHYAVKQKNQEWINILVPRCDLDLKNGNGETALEMLEKSNSEKAFPEYAPIKIIFANATLTALKVDDAVSSATNNYTKSSAHFFKNTDIAATPIEVSKAGVSSALNC